MIQTIIILLILYMFLIERKWGYSKVPFSLKNTMTKFTRKGLHIAELRTIDKKIAKEGLGIIHDAMDKYNVFFWLSEGTALGYVRDNDIISYDDDVDMGIFIEDKSVLIDKVIPELKKHGFKVMFSISNFICLTYKNIDYDIDITGKGKLCVASFLPCDDVLPYLQEFNTVSINNKEYNIPTIDYIRHLYGDTWHIPIKRDKPGVTNRWPMIYKLITTNE